MADMKTSAEAAAATLDGTELVRIVQAGSSVRTTTLAMRDLRGTFSGALVKKSVDQTTADYTTATAIAWDAESYDEGGWHSTASDTSRLTVPAGVTRVVVKAGVVLTNVTADLVVLIQMAKNGSGSFDGTTAQRSEVGTTAPHLSFTSPVLAVTAGDYFEVKLTVETDTSITVNAALSWFSIEKVA